MHLYVLPPVAAGCWEQSFSQGSPLTFHAGQKKINEKEAEESERQTLSTLQLCDHDQIIQLL